MIAPTSLHTLYRGSAGGTGRPAARIGGADAPGPARIPPGPRDADARPPAKPAAGPARLSGALWARSLAARRTEAWITVRALNRMAELGMPLAQRVAWAERAGALGAIGAARRPIAVRARRARRSDLELES